MPMPNPSLTIRQGLHGHICGRMNPDQALILYVRSGCIRQFEFLSDTGRFRNTSMVRTSLSVGPMN